MIKLTSDKSTAKDTSNSTSATKRRESKSGEGDPVKTSPLSNIKNGTEDDQEAEMTVRPQKLDEIIGRVDEKKKIGMMIKSACKRGESVDHILFYGPPGLGKTTFALAIANELGGHLHVTSGPAIQKIGDLATILTSLKRNDVIFIDEIHRLRKGVEEVLYPAMEDGKLDIVVGKGVSAKTLRLNLEQFTLIGATTQIGNISSPMRDRFGLVQRLEFFGSGDLKKMLSRAAKIWKIEADEESLLEIALRSRGTARIALRLLRRVRDFMEAYSKDVDRLNKEIVDEALELLGVDTYGLEDLDRKILSVMYEYYSGGPVGLSTLAATVSDDINTIADVYEPYLLQIGFISRTPRGRMLTEKGVGYAQKLLGTDL